MVSSRDYREIKAKADAMFERHGAALISISQAKQELGLKDTRTAEKALEAMGVEPVAVGRSRRYEIDQLAKAIVAARGMC